MKKKKEISRKLARSIVKLTHLKAEQKVLVFNKVWEVTQMSWPTPIPEKMDRSIVKLIRAS